MFGLLDVLRHGFKHKGITFRVCYFKPESSLNQTAAIQYEKNHFDCYRLKDIREAMDFGAEEYLYSGNYCLIEWPDMISPILPEDTVWIKIRPMENGDRELTIEN